MPRRGRRGIGAYALEVRSVRFKACQSVFRVSHRRGRGRCPISNPGRISVAPGKLNSGGMLGRNAEGRWEANDERLKPKSPMPEG